MKVLVYSHEFPPFLGGLATTSMKLVEGLSSQVSCLVAIVPSYGSNQEIIDNKLNCEIKRVPLLGSRYIRSIPFFQQFLGFFFLFYHLVVIKPDVVLFITEEAESVGGLVSIFVEFRSVVRVAGSGIVTCFHGSDFNKRILKYPMSTLYKKSNRIIAVSNYTKSLLEGIGVDDKKIRVIYNGVKSSMLESPVNKDKVEFLEKKYKINKEDKVIITIARVLPRKGQDHVIRALPGVLKKVPNLIYMIVGEGKYRQEFEKLAVQLNVSSHVIFTGGVENSSIVDFLDLSDLFVMPNRAWNNKVEGLPNAIIEASARGKAVIAGNHSGSVEAVVHGETGLLVDSTDPEKIGDAMTEILTDNHKLKEYGLKGKEFIRNNFREDIMIKNYINQIEEVADI